MYYLYLTFVLFFVVFLCLWVKVHAFEEMTGRINFFANCKCNVKLLLVKESRRNYSAQLVFVASFSKISDRSCFCDLLLLANELNLITLLATLCNSFLMYFIYSVPSAPTNFKTVFRSTSQIKVSWEQPSEPNGVLLGYVLSIKGNFMFQCSLLSYYESL